MPFQKIQSEKLSAAVIRQIELLILRGILRPGERLPAERDLAEKLGVSRPSLREAIADLQDQGLLTAKAGAGIYVADVLGSAFSPSLIRLFSRHDEAVTDYLSFRRDMEGLAAERAAKYGTETDLQVIDQLYRKMEAAGDGMGRELDADFHTAIIEASHNVLMLHMMRSMYDLLREGVFYNRQVMFSQKVTKADLLQQHGRINAAIQARDPVRARAAIERHLDQVCEAYEDQRRAERNEEIARQRLDHERAK
ncbi:FCD domain-containing protein [Aliiroseovarius sp.]|uniref:FadR/GntR family transcriptional regulator n=1 Tax=Aliiroseovarius sp. TaxID=1872442 RepID=UPI002633F727|nr:FCD domain-containing protein [Aliiroseovarius sp.]